MRENKWRAARYGIEAELIVDDDGRTAPLRDLLAELVDDLAPVAERLGCTEELLRAKQILAVGPSYQRQRRGRAGGRRRPARGGRRAAARRWRRTPRRGRDRR